MESKNCAFCRQSGHHINYCPTIVCRRCGIQGHTNIVCKSLEVKRDNFSKKKLWCSYCKIEGDHDYNHCVNPTMKCRICGENGHGTALCKKMKSVKMATKPHTIPEVASNIYLVLNEIPATETPENSKKISALPEVKVNEINPQKSGGKNETLIWRSEVIGPVYIKKGRQNERKNKHGKQKTEGEFCPNNDDFPNLSVKQTIRTEVDKKGIIQDYLHAVLKIPSPPKVEIPLEIEDSEDKKSTTTFTHKPWTTIVWETHIEGENQKNIEDEIPWGAEDIAPENDFYSSDEEYDELYL